MDNLTNQCPACFKNVTPELAAIHRAGGICPNHPDRIKDAQQLEIDKYIHIYRVNPEYKMGIVRGDLARKDLARTKDRGSYLDVGCGRGEMLTYARNDLRFGKVRGTETVPALYSDIDKQFALVTCLPFDKDQFEVVSCFDVLEHLLPQDTEKALKELARVSKHQLLVTANNKPSNSQGVELHINRRHYADWDMLIREHCGGSVEWLDADKQTFSETWLITYD